MKTLKKHQVRNKKGQFINTIYHGDKKHRNKQIHDSSKKRRKARYLLVIDYLKNHPCVDCGETDFVVLQFDHINNDKIKGGVLYMAKNGYGWSKVQAEIDKCEVVCCNCHCRRTYKRVNSYRTRI